MSPAEVRYGIRKRRLLSRAHLRRPSKEPCITSKRDLLTRTDLSDAVLQLHARVINSNKSPTSPRKEPYARAERDLQTREEPSAAIKRALN